MRQNKNELSKKIINLAVDLVIVCNSVIFLIWFIFLICNIENSSARLIVIFFTGFFFSYLYFAHEAVKKTSLEVKIFKFLNYLRETIKVLGSALVVLVFSNFYFKFSTNLYSEFSPLWEKTESILGAIFAFIILYFLVIPLFCFTVLPIILQPIFKKMGKVNFAIFFTIPIIIVITLIYQIVSSFSFIANAALVLGFSLIFIHVRYLIGKIKKHFLQAK